MLELFGDEETWYAVCVSRTEGAFGVPVEARVLESRWLSDRDAEFYSRLVDLLAWSRARAERASAGPSDTDPLEAVGASFSDLVDRGVHCAVEMVDGSIRVTRAEGDSEAGGFFYTGSQTFDRADEAAIAAAVRSALRSGSDLCD